MAQTNVDPALIERSNLEKIEVQEMKKNIFEIRRLMESVVTTSRKWYNDDDHPVHEFGAVHFDAVKNVTTSVGLACGNMDIMEFIFSTFPAWRSMTKEERKLAMNRVILPAIMKSVVDQQIIDKKNEERSRDYGECTGDYDDQ